MISMLIQRVTTLCCLAGGLGFLTMMSLNAAATEYRLFVNDATACANAGVTGSVCLVQLGATTSSTGNSSATTTTTVSSTASTSGSGDCVVTSWNPCDGSASSSTSSSASTSATASTSTTASNSSSGSTSSLGSTNGTLNFGSGGGSATGNTKSLTLEPGTTLTLPFSVVPGKYSGQIAIVPTSNGFPTDGAQVRMWFSSAAGGASLSNRWCSGNLGSEGALTWDQTGAISYGCPIPNQKGELFVNLELCISDRKDRSCSAPGATAGSQAAIIYISGNLYR